MIDISRKRHRETKALRTGFYVAAESHEPQRYAVATQVLKLRFVTYRL
jgi:hypothetical protein